MSERKSKSKSKQSLPNSSSNSCTLVGPFECSNFISPNEYSEKTRGLCAFFLRKNIGNINFSDVLNEIFEHIRLEQAFDLVSILDSKRTELAVNGVSVEKCLMLNRWITYIPENVEYFMGLIHDIYTETITQITGNQQNQIVNYPEDFRQRERDFHKRVDAQKMRRLFYYSPSESKAPSIIYLQNRTTTLLNYLIDSKMRYDRNSRENDLKELAKIFGTSFMVIAQPHSGLNPVLVVERKGTRTHTAKLSVVLISLLHDFMQTHPNMIHLDDIDVELCLIEDPNKSDETKNLYELAKTEKLSWKTCELKLDPNNRPHMVQYAELTNITIEQTSSDAQVHFSDKLHYFNFLIKLSVNINEHKISTIYQIPLRSLSFGIVTYNAHIPSLVTKVMFDDIRRFAQHQSIDVKVVSGFVHRYFMHRTGVEPKADLQNYIKQELTKARNERQNHQSLEEIYGDFLKEFVNQVEFMGKHPILSMLYADGLFLGPCDSVKSAEAMKRSAGHNSPIVGLRFTSIKVDYKSKKRTTDSDIRLRASPCFVRVDIYNPCTNYFQNRTFESEDLMNDIMEFVLTARDERANTIRIFSDFDVYKNNKLYQYFTKYYDERLQIFHKEDPKYRPIIDFLNHVNETNDNNSNNYPNRSNLPMNSLLSTITVAPAVGLMVQNSYSPPNQQTYPFSNDNDVVKYVLSKPELCLNIVRRCNQMRLLALSPIQHSPHSTSFTKPNQTTIENSYTSVFSENSLQQQLSQTQSISMSTNDLCSEETPLEPTNTENYGIPDDLNFLDSP